MEETTGSLTSQSAGTGTGPGVESSPEVRPGPMRIVVIEDHPLMREGLMAMLDHESDMQVVGAASDAEEGLCLIGALAPDVVLMDIRMPGIDGLEATRRINTQHPGVRVLVLTAYDNEPLFREAMEAGAAGFLSKDSFPSALLYSIRAVHAGWVGVKADRLRVSLTGSPIKAGPREARPNGADPKPKGKSDGNGLARLTERELEVLQLLADGCSNKEIAVELNTALVTVKKHVQSITGKLGVSDRTQAAVFAVRSGLLN
jgi:DNA-binding NarL/FixJ family response regulator